MSKVVVFGNSAFARVNAFYLIHDSPHAVVAYTVDGAHIRTNTLDDLPVVPFENIESVYPPEEYELAIPIGLRRVNSLRAEKYRQAKTKGYRFAGYLSSKAVTWPGVTIGENCFIYEQVVIKPFVVIGDDVIVEAGSVIGHHTVIGDHCFVSTDSAINSEVTLEPYCLLGANATVRDGIRIAQACIVGAGTVISRDTRAESVYLGNPAEMLPGTSSDLSALFEEQA